MIHRVQRGQVPRKPHTVFEPDGKLAFEHCFTRQGFEGTFSILYNRTPLHYVESERDAGPHPGAASCSWDGALRRRHFLSGDIEAGGTPFMSRRVVMGNPQIRLWIAKPDKSDETLVLNSEADELIFVHKGKGRLETPMGVVAFGEQDYFYVPRGLPHRVMIDEPSYFLVMEGRTYIDVPKQYRNPAGQITMYAPYTHRDFREPEWPEGGPASLGAPKTVLALKEDRITETVHTHDQFDVVGWDGQLWPFAFNIRDFQPKTGLVHLPPTIHIAFVGDGFVICSFVPRKTDFHEKAIPCPYPHSSPSCDEVLFYVEGNFTSRKGVGPGSMSLHPTGVTHGPHPGTYEGSIGSKETNEMAVMIDTFLPLLPSDHARKVEDQGYNRSWVKKS